MKKINWETVKTVVIAVLATSIITFISGMKYQEHQSNLVKTEALTLVKDVKSEPLKK